MLSDDANNAQGSMTKAPEATETLDRRAGPPVRQVMAKLASEAAALSSACRAT